MTQNYRSPLQPEEAIELDGIHGTFRIEKCAFAIHYFSTFATPSPTENEEHYSDLLKELNRCESGSRQRTHRPKRSFTTRLERRTHSAGARALPLCKVSESDFFPPILAVLVPSGFIDKKATSSKDYPVGQKSGADFELWKTMAAALSLPLQHGWQLSGAG